MPEARIFAVYVGPKARGPLHAVTSAVAVAGRGLEGDRYCSGRGALSRWMSPARAVSFIEREAIDALRQEFAIDLGDGRSRRNVVTEGIRLEELKGRTFRVGTAVFKGVQACQPCRYLERLTQPGVFEALKGRGGLRAEVVEGGAFAPGDVIEVVAAFPPSPLYSGERGRGRGALGSATKPLTPDPSPLSTGARGGRGRHSPREAQLGWHVQLPERPGEVMWFSGKGV